MAPTLSLLSAQLRQLVFYHLDNNLLKNALFLAGRLHALDQRNQDAIHLLALCHQRLGQYKAAYDYTRHVAIRGAHLGCCYVFAQACLALGKIADGIHALERSRPLWDSRSPAGRRPESQKRYIPDSAALYSVLGNLLEARSDTKRAMECHLTALKLNPFMWDSFERICNSGTKVRVQNIFKNSSDLLSVLSPILTFAAVDDSRPNSLPASNHQQNGIPQIVKTDQDPFLSGRSRNQASSFATFQDTTQDPSNGSHSNGVGIGTPPVLAAQGPKANGLHSRPTTNQGAEAPNAPPRKLRIMPGGASSTSQDLSMARPPSRRRHEQLSPEDLEPSETSQQVQQATQTKRHVSGAGSQINSSSITDAAQAPPRRSRRLFTQIRPNVGKVQPPPAPPPPVLAPLNLKEHLEPKKVKATGTRGRSATQSTVGRVVSGNRKPMESGDNSLKESRPQVAPVEQQVMHASLATHQDLKAHNDALQWLLDLFSRLGQGYYSLGLYQNLEAIRHFNLLPPQQRDTPWVLAQIGKAYYEQTNFADSEKSFARLRKLVPSRLEEMEIYSTVLWHLKNDTELSFLAHELIDADRMSPQAWCTIGNSFSLQRDHDQALKCFKRASQLDPKFPYAFTLQGHEHMSNEDYESALQAYRRALSADNRHYNGWYGLGKVYEKLGKHDMAEKHYRAAASINPTNGVLVCCMGVVLEKLRQPEAALRQYRHALEINPRFGIARFRSAKVLLSLQDYEAALEELKLLKDMAPDESNVHFMLGRVYKQLEQKGEALRHYTIAMNLDPKAAQTIKEAMQALNDDYEEEFDDEDDD